MHRFTGATSRILPQDHQFNCDSDDPIYPLDADKKGLIHNLNKGSNTSSIYKKDLFRAPAQSTSSGYFSLDDTESVISEAPAALCSTPDISKRTTCKDENSDPISLSKSYQRRSNKKSIIPEDNVSLDNVSDCFLNIKFDRDL